MALRKYFALTIVALLVIQTFAASILERRSVESSEPTDTTQTETCQRNTPCGWAVYTRFTRVVDYFMKNKCECPEGKRCVRTDDDISVAAYVYRCRDVKMEDPSDNNS